MNNRILELARKAANYGQKNSAQKAYRMVLAEAAEKAPALELESASYLFFSKDEYRPCYQTFVSLYNRGQFQAELMGLLTQAFYQPNVDKQRRRYAENCRKLSRYPYLFRKDFPDFDDLPVKFFPYEEKRYFPFDSAKGCFLPLWEPSYPKIDRWFFRDLEQPIFAVDVYSQYQLAYLRDCVRRSDLIGRDNHIYLHYTNWETFCSYLACLDFSGLLGEEKFVFLIEEESAQYPIDFRARFGIDYSQYPVQPVGIREINRLIWHTQLSAHNGGDFFNEVFHNHPNLIMAESVMYDNIYQAINTIKSLFHQKRRDIEIVRRLQELKNPTDKDFLVAYFLYEPSWSRHDDPNARIAPALFLQPHFYNIAYDHTLDPKTGQVIMRSQEYDRIRTSPLFKGFQYMKAFTPMRRITTSYAATLRFMVTYRKGKETIQDALMQRVLTRSYLIDPEDPLQKDSVLVRFEDGKLNPRATFTALAEFLDLPYTESMTYCSDDSGQNPESYKGNARGFDPVTVYRTYDEYANDAERAFLEYFMRDAYKAYGYDFQYYKGEAVDLKWVEDKINHFDCINSYMREGQREALLYATYTEKNIEPTQQQKERMQEDVEKYISAANATRKFYANCLLQGLQFVNTKGQPLQLTPLLKLDPALLEQPLYH